MGGYDPMLAVWATEYHRRGRSRPRWRQRSVRTDCLSAFPRLQRRVAALHELIEALV